jgi:hypothetical protein
MIRYFSLDATEERTDLPYLGRLINHDRGTKCEDASVCIYGTSVSVFGCGKEPSQKARRVCTIMELNTCHHGR